MERQTDGRRERQTDGRTGRQMVGKQTDGGTKDRWNVTQTNKMNGRKTKG
jgi:hypothetical protein